MPLLPKPPSPSEFAKTWTRGFARAVRDAAGDDGRLTVREGEKIAERPDGLSVYADNVAAFFEETGQKSVAADKLIGAGHRYTEAHGERVAGDNQTISLLEARMLPSDLRTEFFALRGHSDPLPGPTAMRARLGEVMDAGVAAYFVDREEPHVREVSAKTLDDVKQLLRAGAGGDAIEVTDGPAGEAGAEAAVIGMRSFAEQALGPHARRETDGALGRLVKDAQRYGEDAQLLHVVTTSGGEESYADVLVLGLSTTRPLLLEIPE